MLTSLGWSEFFERQLGEEIDASTRVARVAAEHRGVFEIWCASGGALRAFPAELAGRLRHEGASAPGVGDWVVLRAEAEPHAGSPRIIERVLDRRTVFTRAAAGRAAGRQVIAANVDQVLIVTGVDGDVRRRRLERYVAQVAASGAEPIIVLTKADLLEGERAPLDEIARAFPEVPCVLASAATGEGLPMLRAWIASPAGPPRTTALVGSSGVGKSTLVNALLGGEVMRTGEVRTSDRRGCHTTTHRQMILLTEAEGVRGILIETPGMRELALCEDEGLDAAFAELATVAQACRFRDCHHQGEPGCAVRAAIDAGELDAERVAHAEALREEALANERRLDVRQRRAAERAFGKRIREAKMIARSKG
jgi:ribosome biogenesis GTPase